MAAALQQRVTLSGNGAEVLAEAVAVSKARFVARNPASRQLFMRAQRSMPGGNTRTALHFDPFPLYMERSAGAFVEDVDGHRYLDVLGEFSAGLYGHADPQISTAVERATRMGGSNGAPGLAEIRLAELICGRFPSVEKVRFCNSGTEANLYALTLARAVTGRSKFICFKGAYHGGIFVFAEGGSAMNAPFDWTVCRFNDVDQARSAIAGIGPDLAAVIVEPLMSNGGCIPATRQFLKSLRDACSATGAVLIFDEVVSSRMGRSGLQGTLGVTPDLTTFGKYLGAGFSFGAFGGRADLLDHMDPTRPGALPHAGTFNNNVYTMGCGIVGLEGIFTPERAERFFADGERVRERLNGLSRAASPFVQFTGCGSVMNIHFQSGPVTCPDDLQGEPRDLFSLFHLDLLEHGIYAARRGQFNLSLPIGPSEEDVLAQAVGGFLRRYAPMIDDVLTNSRAAR